MDDLNDDIKEVIVKYSLQNSLKYKGKANPGAVIGKILAEVPHLKENLSEISKEVNKIIKEINILSLEDQQKKLQEMSPELLEKKKEIQGGKGSNIFDFLGIPKNQKVVTAFPPEPSKHPHLGHAKAIVVNYELAKRYNGIFYLRFEDTNPELVEDDFYKSNIEDYEWLGIIPDKIEYASDYMDQFYSYAKKIIKDGNAYICSCDQEKIRKERRECIECECRGNKADDNLERWKKMFNSQPGEYILRLKGDMQSLNTTIRDPVIFRVIDEPHPRTKKKYRVWPNYDFESSIMDGIEGITHRLRSKEFELRNELQRLIQNFAGFKETNIYEFARFNLEGVESSGRIIREKIKKKELIGWDDPSLTTLKALRRRGFLPDAIKSFVISTGLTKTESVLKWDDLAAHNRRLIDPICNRYFFVENPKKITIENAPNQLINLKLHPNFEERGSRKFNTKDEFYISENDLNKFEDGKLYRLMDCFNIVIKFTEGQGVGKKRFIFDSLDYTKYKEYGEKTVHWLPIQKELVNVEVIMPNKDIKKGLAEQMVKELKVGDLIQFSRFGFCKLDNKKEDKLIFWYTHD